MTSRRLHAAFVQLGISHCAFRIRSQNRPPPRSCTLGATGWSAVDRTIRECGMRSAECGMEGAEHSGGRVALAERAPKTLRTMRNAYRERSQCGSKPPLTTSRMGHWKWSVKTRFSTGSARDRRLVVMVAICVLAQESATLSEMPRLLLNHSRFVPPSNSWHHKHAGSGRWDKDGIPSYERRADVTG